MKKKKLFFSPQTGVRAKIPYTRKKQRGRRTLPRDVILQNKFRGQFNSLLKQLSLTPTKEIGTGIDYIYNFFAEKKRRTIKLDLKFSFGALGENTIKIRVMNRKLINESDWILAINRNRQAQFFPKRALANYVTMHWGSISKYRQINKGSYIELPVNLLEFYSKMNVTPINTKLETREILQALKQIQTQETQAEQKPKQTILKTRLRPPKKLIVKEITKPDQRNHFTRRMNNRGRR